jgi:hypothetical protein
LLALIAGCAEATRSASGDLSGATGDLSFVVEDGGEDLAVELPDLTLVCDAGAGFRACKGKCISAEQCCDDSDCPTPSNGAPLCNNLNKCDVTCAANYKACNGACITATLCCSDADCTTPGDPCKLVQGATCTSGICSYPAVQCPYAGQFCNGSGACVCPNNQHPCVTVGAGGPNGQCIPDNTCCTNADCGGISGQVCTGIGMTCQCTAGLKACTDSHSCIPSTSCCNNSDCTGGATCSGPGGSCNCPAMQKSCLGVCIAITACCVDADCSAVSGRICGAGGVCQCPTGKRECDPAVGSPTCITDNPSVCCVDSDCSVSGAKCSGIAGSCSCPANTYQCNTSCIGNNNCCTSGDCFRIRGVNGESCSAPGGTCSCPPSTKECGATGTCVSTAAGRCCTASDCPTGGSSTTHVATANCSSTNCSVAAGGCQGGWVDVNHSWSDGCECPDDGFGKSCTSASGLGNIGVPGSTSRTGVLPLAGEENWFIVTFNGTRNNSYHPHITISASGGDDIRFDIFTGPTCGGGTLSCPSEGGGAAANITNWEEVENQGADQSGLGCGSSTVRCNTTCNCTTGYIAMPVVGSNGTVFIRVHRVFGSPTCNSYTLSVVD